ncbi:MAG: urease accessory protein UreG [Nitriliruptoraceae bacterium]|nr:urease accessory protein UreG [Nitriliruptoraceae bacterium]
MPADPDAAAAGGSGAAAAAGTPPDRRTVRIGIGGPVGSGKTALIATLCRELADRWSVAVVTNDIYTTEDADRLRRDGVLDDDRIVAVRTGCCPHTAVRDDITANLDAVEGLEAAHPDLDLVLVESGGDNLTLTWSQALVDHEVFVIDVAAGDDIPRKGGPGVTRSDLLIVNKTDLAPYVRVDLDGMARDAEVARAGATTIFVSTVEDPSGAPVRDWVNTRLKARAAVAPA